jgi:hypothetical protein
MELQISLRGTIAEDYYSIRDQHGASAATAFLIALVSRPAQDIAMIISADGLVIGRISEQGQFGLDW